MIFTSIIKNNTRNIEKNIEKLNTEIFNTKKELLNAEIDFIYLSSPDKTRKNYQHLIKKYSIMIIQEFFYQHKTL